VLPAGLQYRLPYRQAHCKMTYLPVFFILLVLELRLCLRASVRNTGVTSGGCLPRGGSLSSNAAAPGPQPAGDHPHQRARTPRDHPSPDGKSADPARPRRSTPARPGGSVRAALASAPQAGPSRGRSATETTSKTTSAPGPAAGCQRNHRLRKGLAEAAGRGMTGFEETGSASDRATTVTG